MATLTATQPRPYRISAGIGAGAGAALVMMLVMALMRLIFGLLTIPELLLNPILRVMGGQAFSDMLDRLYYAGRPLLFATILEGTLLLGALLGLLYAAFYSALRTSVLRPSHSAFPLGGIVYGLIIGLLLNVVFLPLIGQAPFASTPAGLFSTSPIPLWLGLMALALVFGIVLHLLLPRGPSAFYADDDGDLTMDAGRRDFLRVLGGSLLALVGGAAFAGAGTVLVQGGFQSPGDDNSLVPGPGSPGTQSTTPTALPTATRKPATSTPRPRPSNTPTHTPTPVPTDVPTAEPTPTFTPEPPTNTPIPPTDTPTPSPTPTSVPPIMVAEITPVESFYHVSKNFFDPEPDGNTWRLEVTGLVDNPYSLTYTELISMPSVEVVVGMMCISNPIGGDFIGNTRWRGVRLADLLAKASPQIGVVDVAMTAADGYTDSITYEKALDTDVVLVWEMDGNTLTYSHGYPARLLVPGIYGMKHVKWITRIELVDYNFKGFWQQPDQGWSEPAPVNTMSKIDHPVVDKALQMGTHTLSGVAFAGDRSISRVEVSTDDGDTWVDAYVKPKLSETSWVVWAYNWTPPSPGKYTVRVRATDGQGNVQTSRRTDPYPNGATGHHSRTYTIRG